MKNRYVILIMLLVLSAISITYAYDYGTVNCGDYDGIFIYCSDGSAWVSWDGTPPSEMVAYFDNQNKYEPIPDQNPYTYVTGGQSENLSGSLN